MLFFCFCCATEIYAMAHLNIINLQIEFQKFMTFVKGKKK